MTFNAPLILTTFCLIVLTCFFILKRDYHDYQPVAIVTDQLIEDRIQFLSYSANQKRLRIKQNKKADSVEALFFSYSPEIACPTTVRMGGFEDGGKWVCNPWRLPAENCTVYSVGLGRNVQFDLEVLSKFRCRLYGFDPNPNYGNSLRMQAALVNSSTFSLFFQPWFIEKTTNFAVRRVSLAKAFEYYRTEKIDILKIDAEGNEFDILNEFFSFKRNVYICQLLLEVHTRSVEKWRSLFGLLNKVGYLLFSREANVYSIRPSVDSFCVEYSYIHKSCLTSFGLTDSMLTSNFDGI